MLGSELNELEGSLVSLGVEPFTCLWIIQVSLIDKDFVKNDGSGRLHGNRERCREGEFGCVGINTRQT